MEDGQRGWQDKSVHKYLAANAFIEASNWKTAIVHESNENGETDYLHALRGPREDGYRLMKDTILIASGTPFKLRLEVGAGPGLRN